MVKVVTLRSFMVQLIFSPFLQLENPQTIPTNFPARMENGLNYFLRDELWLVLFFLMKRCDFS